MLADARCPVKLPLDEPFNFIHTCLLIVMNPPDAVVTRYVTYIDRQICVNCWELEMLVEDWNHVLVMVECTTQLQHTASNINLAKYIFHVLTNKCK